MKAALKKLFFCRGKSKVATSAPVTAKSRSGRQHRTLRFNNLNELSQMTYIL
ncbi:hypothetical protein [Nibrella saemangeumensis]|uniref:hypothetical protein n=1 Tax=Nibrella saemangeumensis TaxID=1084526 RepID=UPI0031F150BF